MKKISALLLVGILAIALLVGCGSNGSSEVDYNTVDNNTSEEYIDPETGANLRDTTAEIIEEEGLIPDDETDPGEYIDGGEEEVTPTSVEEGGEEVVPTTDSEEAV